MAAKEKEVKRLKLQVKRLELKITSLQRDWNDMYDAHQTTFQRCACGRLRERGLMCPAGCD